jgi:hypothetical protein
MEPVAPVAEPEPEIAAQSVPHPDDEQRGESVVRDVLGAKLIATIDDAATPVNRSAPDGDTPAIFDLAPAPEKD